MGGSLRFKMDCRRIRAVYLFIGDAGLAAAESAGVLLGLQQTGEQCGLPGFESVCVGFDLQPRPEPPR